MLLNFCDTDGLLSAELTTVPRFLITLGYWCVVAFRPPAVLFSAEKRKSQMVSPGENEAETPQFA